MKQKTKHLHSTNQTTETVQSTNISLTSCNLYWKLYLIQFMKSSLKHNSYIKKPKCAALLNKNLKKPGSSVALCYKFNNFD